MDFKKSIKSVIPCYPLKLKSLDSHPLDPKFNDNFFNRNYTIEDTSIYSNANDYLRELIDTAKRLN